MKVKEGHRRDFWAYVWFNRKVNKRLGNQLYFCPEKYSFERGNINTLKCFVEYESTGKMSGNPKQPMLLTLAMDGKKLLNWHIKEWAAGLHSGEITAWWDLKEYLFVLPDWVSESLHNQWMKLILVK